MKPTIANPIAALGGVRNKHSKIGTGSHFYSPTKRLPR